MPDTLALRVLLRAEAVRRRARAFEAEALARADGKALDPWQRELLRSTSQQLLMLVCRQGGKSTTAALLAASTALRLPGGLVLLLAAAWRQSAELFRSVRRLVTLPTIGAPPLVRESALSLELATGARVVSLPGQGATIRGYSSVSLLVIDEGARLSDDLYMSVRPMVAISRGRIVALSTPAGARGWFWEAATARNTADEWHRAVITADQVPRFSPEWLAAERARIGEWWYRQEYLCSFEDSASQVFASADIEAAFDTNIPPLFPQRVA